MPEWFNNPLFIFAPISGAIALIWKFGGWYTAVNTDRGDFTDFMKAMEGELKEINARINGIFIRLKGAPFTSQSPLQLTDLGHTISKEMLAEQWAIQVATDLIDAAKGKPDHEIHEFAFDYAKNRMIPTKTMDEHIRSAAYKYSLSRGQVLEIMAIELRNKLMEWAKQANE